MGNSYHTASTYYSTCIEFEKNIYSKGAVRYAYKDKSNKLIVKTFKNRAYNTRKNWECDIEASKKAASQAIDFIQDLKNANSTYSLGNIEFVIPYLAKVNNASCVITTPNKCVCKDQYVLIEPYLTGSYIKFSDNQGFESKDFGTRPNILYAFSHWTYEKSGHTLLVSDLQGTDNEDHFMLTDPAIHSGDKKFGLTDLSYAGMKRVMDGHACNEHCKHLNLPLYESAKSHKPKSRTILSTQLSKKEKRSNTELQQQSIVSHNQIETQV